MEVAMVPRMPKAASGPPVSHRGISSKSVDRSIHTVAADRTMPARTHMTGTNHIPPKRREGRDTCPIYPTRATPDAALWRAVAPKPTWWDQGAGGLNWSPGTLRGKGHSALAEVRWRLRPRRRRRGCCCGRCCRDRVVVGDHACVRVFSGDSDVSLGLAGVEGHGHEGVAQGMGVMRLVTLPARATRPTIRAAPRRSSRIPLFVRSTGPEVRSPMAAPTAHAVRWEEGWRGGRGGGGGGAWFWRTPRSGLW